MPRLNPISSHDYTPSKWYPVSDSSGKIKVNVTPRGAAKQRIIYIFRNKETGQVLIGKTSQTAAKRLAQYQTTFNHPERDYGKGMFPTAVRKNPNAFEFGILYEPKVFENLDEWEKMLIIAYDSIKKGFNQNTGKGGGTAASSPSRAPASPGEVYATPKKYYRLDLNTAGQAVLNLTPTARKARNVVYVFKKIAGDGVYIGMTNDFTRRAQEHVRASRHAATDRGELPLPASIRRNPSNFKAGILARGGDLQQIERKMIAEAAKTGRVYNQNAGGGGSLASSRPPVNRKLF